MLGAIPENVRRAATISNRIFLPFAPPVVDVLEACFLLERASVAGDVRAGR